MTNPVADLAEKLALIGDAAPRQAWDDYELHRPQYSLAEIRRAVAAERERCAKLCDACGAILAASVDPQTDASENHAMRNARTPTARAHASPSIAAPTPRRLA